MNSADDHSSATHGSAPGGGRWEPPAAEDLQAMLHGYEVIAMIGRGGMGAVYKARQISLDRMVAIKILPPALWDDEEDYAERFRNEARLMAKLMHSGMIAVFDFGTTDDGQLYFVMEFVEGTDVSQMIGQSGKLPPMQALAIAAHVCDTLTYAHEHGIIHRDIKPANVMVDLEGRVKVADFGLAKLAAQDTGTTRSTMTMGTPDYVAPESLIIDAEVDHRADLYSLGVMLCQMLTGRVPRGIFALPSDCVPGLDKRFNDIVVRAMQGDPAARFQSAVEFRKALDHILTVPVASVERKQAAQQRIEALRTAARVQNTPRQSSAPWGLITAGVVGLAAAGAYFMFKPRTTPVVSEPAPAPDAAPASSASSSTSSPAPSPAPEPIPPAETKPTPAPSAAVTLMPAPKPESEAERRLDELETQFRAAMGRDVTKVHDAAVAALGSNYSAALDRSLSAATTGGRLQEALALRDEKQRLETRQPLPAEDANDLPATLKDLRSTYRTELAKLTADRDKGSADLCDKYEQVLASYQKELTTAGRLDEALLVAEKQKSVGASRRIHAAKVEMADEGAEYVTAIAQRDHANSAEGIFLRGDEKFSTKDTFTPPVEITIVAKTDKYNLRLGYAAEQVVFNWERNPSELRVDGGPASGKHKKGAGSIPEDTFVTIKWVVTPDSQTICLDGDKRFEHRGDYSKIDNAISVFASNSHVTLKSLKVKKGPGGVVVTSSPTMANPSGEGTLKALLAGKEPWTVDVTFPPGIYHPKNKISLGKPDKGGTGDPVKAHRAIVTTGAGTQLDSADIFLNVQSIWRADGTLFKDCKIAVEMNGHFEAKNSLFQSCELRKGGVWWVGFASSKWEFENCAFNRAFLKGWKTGDIGVKIHGCIFYGVDFPVLIYKSDAGKEALNEWVTIRNCRFLNCKVPESVLIATQECVFEGCEFGNSEDDMKIVTPVKAVIYSTGAGVAPATGPGRTIEVLDARLVPHPAGTTLRHRKSGSGLVFE